MTWHSFPHIPEDGAHILALYRGCEEGNLFERKIQEGEELGYIEKWCYYEDYTDLMKRKILYEKDI